MARDQNKFKVEIKITLPAIVWVYDETENNLFWYEKGRFALLRLLHYFVDTFLSKSKSFKGVRVKVYQEIKGDQRHEPKFRPIIDTQRDYLPKYFQE